MHKYLIGDGAPLNVTSDNDGVFGWAHQQGHSRSSVGGMVMMLANPRSIPANVSVAVDCVVNRRVEYILAGADDNDPLGSFAARLNGAKTALALASDGTPPAFARLGRVVEGASAAALPVSMPPHSYGFVELDCTTA